MFNGPPFFEDWSIDSALEEICYAFSFKDSRGVAYSSDGQLRGFAWGYNLPDKNSGRVDYEKISREAEAAGSGRNDVFYLAEAGVRSDDWNKGIGASLVGSLDSAIERPYVAMRTMNPAMVRVAEKVWGRELMSFPEESAYEGGRVYVYRR